MIKPLVDTDGEPMVFHHSCPKEWDGRVMESWQKEEFATDVLYSIYFRQGSRLRRYNVPSNDYPVFAIELNNRLTKNFTIECVDDIDAPYSRDNSAAMRLFRMNGTYPRLVLVSMMCLETMDLKRPLCGGHFVFKVRYESMLDNCQQTPLGEEKTHGELIEVLADAWRNMDYRIVEPYIGARMHYESAWVFDIMPCKEEFVKYLAHKFRNIGRGTVGVSVEANADTGEKCVKLTQRNKVSMLVIRSEGGYITEMKMCEYDPHFSKIDMQYGTRSDFT